MALIGVLLAGASALLASGTDVLRKHNSKAFDPIVAAWALHGTTFLLALPVTLLVNGVGLHALESLRFFAHPFPVSGDFWVAFIIAAALAGVASFLWMRALGRADLSVASPLSTLTPALILLTAPLVTGEIPSLVGVFGVVIVTIGLFLLASAKHTHPLMAFKELFRHSAHRDALFVAVLFAIVAPWQKRAVLEGGSLWYTLLIHGSLLFAFFPLVLRKGRLKKITRSRSWPGLLPFGFFNLLRSYAEFTALGFLPTFYVSGLKRSGILLNVLWGRIFFKEKETFRRLIAAGVMLIGAILILWASLT